MATQSVVTATEKTVDDVRAGAFEQFAKDFGDLSEEPQAEQQSEQELDSGETTALSQEESRQPEESEPEESDEEPQETEDTPEETEEPEKSEEAHKGIDPETQEKINRRIARITAKAKAREEELQAKLEAAEAKLQTQPLDQNQQNPVVDTINDVAGLKKVQQEAQKVAEDAEVLLNALDSKPDQVSDFLKSRNIVCEDDGTGSYTVDSMRSQLNGIFRNANKVIASIPRRETFLKAQEANLNKALEEMPELKDEHSDEREAFDKFIEEYPGIKSVESWPKAALAYVRGTLRKPVRQANPKPLKRGTKPSAAPPGQRPGSREQNGRSIDWNAVVSGDRDAKASLFDSLLEN